MVDAALALSRNLSATRVQTEKLRLARGRLSVSTLGLAVLIGLPLDDLPALPSGNRPAGSPPGG